MEGRLDSDRKQPLEESLLSANTGCTLVFVFVFGLPIAGIGGFFVYLGLSTMHDQARLHDLAISVPATIVSSEVGQSTTNTDSASKLYWADIKFTYAYKGKVRNSDKVWPVGES